MLIWKYPSVCYPSCNGCGQVTCHHWAPDVAPHEWCQWDWRVRPRRSATLLERRLLRRSMSLLACSVMLSRRRGPPICCAAVNCCRGMRSPAVTPFLPPVRWGGGTSDACKVFRRPPGPLPWLIVHARPSGLRFRSTPLIVTRRAGRHGISLVPREKPRMMRRSWRRLYFLGDRRRGARGPSAVSRRVS